MKLYISLYTIAIAAVVAKVVQNEGKGIFFGVKNGSQVKSSKKDKLKMFNWNMRH